MAVGRLTSLGTAVTISTSNSVSLTVPNNGTVAAGDLLVWASALPSGSRTLAVTGITGSTALPMVTQSGHGSQVWYKIAASGDIGATLTVTPSTGAIKQVLLLGYVTGADPVNPVGNAGTAFASAATTASLTHTTPSVASAPSNSRELNFLFDSRGSSVPQTASWTAPAGITRASQAFTTDTTQATSGASGDSDALVSGTIGSRAWTTDQSALGSAWTIAIVASDISVTADVPSGTGAANDALVALSALPGTPVGAGTAQDAAASMTAISATPAGTGTAYDSLVSVAVGAGLAAGAGTAYDVAPPVPPAPHEDVSGREPGGAYGYEPVSSASGREPIRSVAGQEVGGL
jgi:hypothetical protein